MQPIETIEEFEELRRVDLSEHEPIVLETDDDIDEMEAFDRDH